MKLIECVPNFSEGRDMNVIRQITNEIESVEGVRLLDVDPGKATNRTVVTFVGEPAAVIEAAYLGIKKAAELIDMSKHKGEHPRMGATDVCPLVPIRNVSMEEAVEWANKLAQRVGEELNIPCYLYEAAAKKPAWKNLAVIRAGEYEALADKLTKPEWKPNYGPAIFNEGAGATAIGARDFLVAYNVNINSTSVRRANSIAFDVREKGRVKREGGKISGKIIRDAQGTPLREEGMCKSVKGIGWFIEEYGLAQISMNLTDIKITALHEAFEACCTSANKRGLRVTGSELVGLVPLQVMLDAGKYFMEKQERSAGISEAELVRLAIKTMGLDELSPFDPNKKIIEYLLEDESSAPLVHMKLNDFADETASESPAPGGGSIAAYVGALGVSLATMVANLSAHKRGWDKRWKEFSDHAETGQAIKDELLNLVDKDTDAFNQIMTAFRLPKGSDEEKQQRLNAIEAATRNAIEVPLSVMKTALKSFDLISEMAHNGNPNSVSDAGVGALCARAAVRGAYLNVQINAGELNDKNYIAKVLKEGAEMVKLADKLEAQILKVVDTKISGS